MLVFWCFFFKQKTAYEMRISDWSSDVCSSDLLVAFIREETGDWYEIEVAAYPEFHPEARSPAKDLQYFKRKVDAGADAAITQYFYNVDAYFSFMDQCGALSIDVPVVPGVMPIYNYTQLSRFSDVCGAEIPRWLKIRLQEY